MQKDSQRRSMGWVLSRCGVIFVALIFLYLLLGVAAWLVPDALVRRNVERSLYTGDLLEDYPKAILFDDLHVQDRTTLDNFTDALIVNQVICLRSHGLKGVLLLPRYQEKGESMSNNLRHLMDGAEHGEAKFYSRYWHGSTFVVRILMATSTTMGIRYLLCVISSLLMAWMIARLWRLVGPMISLCLLWALLMVNVFVMQFSLQFAPVLLIALVAMLWLTYHRTLSIESTGLLFFIIGSLTTYFDLITVPTLTLGLPLVVWVAFNKKATGWQGWRQVLMLAAWWLVGYVLTWLAKWGIASLLTPINVFADAYSEAEIWNEDGGGYITKALGACLSKLHWAYIAVAMAILLIMALVHPQKGKGSWQKAAVYVLVALIPFVYYLLMAKPAWHHSWFNYRALATTIASLLMALSCLVDWKCYARRAKRL